MRDVERVKSQASIVEIIGGYISLTRSGQNYFGACPFHSEKTPSFAVHPEKQIYHCFGCGVGGDVFKFIEAIEGVSFPEALQLVAVKVGVELKRNGGKQSEERLQLLDLNNHAQDHFERMLWKDREGRRTLEFLRERGLSDETIKQFRLGCASGGGAALWKYLQDFSSPEKIIASGLVNKDERGVFYDRFRHRVIFPFEDESGRIMAFAGRGLDDVEPKYLTSRGTSLFKKGKLLYNLQLAKESIRAQDYAIVVEGFFDCIAVYTGAIKNVVGTFGTGVTDAQAKLLRRLTPNAILNFDSDTAGAEASLRVIELMLRHGLKVRVVSLPTGSDPDSFIRKEGKEVYLKKLKESSWCLDFLFQQARQKCGNDNVAVARFLLPFAAQVSDALRRDEWLADIAMRLHLNEATLRNELQRAITSKKVMLESINAPVRSAPLAERRLLKVLLDNEEARSELLWDFALSDVHKGATLEVIFDRLFETESVDVEVLSEGLSEEDARLLYRLAFEENGGTVEEARSCLAVMVEAKRRAELRELQGEIEKAEKDGDVEQSRKLLRRKQELRNGAIV